MSTNKTSDGVKVSVKSGTKSHRRPYRGILHFPVGRIERHMRQARFARRIGKTAPLYLAAVLEYMVAEVAELAGNAAINDKRHRITPRHLQAALRRDSELARLVGSVSVAGGGSATFYAD